MARCDQGYLCDVCGQEVEAITESDLYLRYILGEVPPELLTLSPERHIRCNPAVAQFIINPAFSPVTCPGAFDKSGLDPDFVQKEEARITRGWTRLQEVPSLGVPVTSYPLPEIQAAWNLPHDET
jgi:hypothetical protein